MPRQREHRRRRAFSAETQDTARCLRRSAAPGAGVGPGHALSLRQFGFAVLTQPHVFWGAWGSAAFAEGEAEVLGSCGWGHGTVARRSAPAPPSCTSSFSPVWRLAVLLLRVVGWQQGPGCRQHGHAHGMAGRGAAGAGEGRSPSRHSHDVRGQAAHASGHPGS